MSIDPVDVPAPKPAVAPSESQAPAESALTVRTVRSRLLWIAVAILCAAVMVGDVFVTVQAWLSSDQSTVSVTESEEVLPLPPGDEVQQVIPPLPLRSDADPVGQAVVSGEITPGVNNAASNALMRQLATQLGLGDVILQLGNGSTVQDNYWQRKLPFPKSYPYQYTSIDGRVASDLKFDGHQDQIDAALDLATLLVIQQTDVSSAVSRSLEQPDDKPAVAFSILRQMAERHNNCELRTQMLVLTALAEFHPNENTIQAADDALAICEDDTVPLLVLGQFQATASLYQKDFGSGAGSGTVEDIDSATDSFQRIIDDYPDSPIGYAVMADFLMDRADKATERGTRPFTVRNWYSQANGLYLKARSLSDDPELLIGQARALRGLSRYDEAKELLESIPPALAGLDSVIAERVRLNVALRDFEAALNDAETEATSSPDSLINLAPRRVRSNQYSAGYGRMDVTQTMITMHPVPNIGAGQVHDASLIPAFRWEHPSPRYQRETEMFETYLEASIRDLEVLFGQESLIAGETYSLSSGYYNAEAFTGEDENPYEETQDLFRWAGDFESAKQVLNDWQNAFPDSYLPYQRGAEIAYLEGDYQQSVDLFAQAAEMLPDLEPDSRLTLQPNDVIAIQLAFAYYADGDTGAAKKQLTQMSDSLTEKFGGTCSGEDCEDAALFHTNSLLGMILVSEGKYDEAIALLEPVVVAQQAAAERLRGDGSPVVDADGDPEWILLRGAQENNLALAYLNVGRTAEAVTMAQQALSRDQYNPIFLDTLATAYQGNGQLDLAVEQYQSVLDQDSTSYVSANNLAVILAQAGDVDRATQLLESAVAANPDYAIGWHNLGVVREQARQTFTAVFSSLSSAGRIDNQYRGEDLDLVLDSEVYDTGLDISKALPPDWSYADSASSTTNNFTVSMIALLLLRVLWALGLDKTAGGLMARMASARPGIHSPALDRIRVGVSLLVSMAVVAMPAIGWAIGGLDKALLGLSLAALVGLGFSLRMALAPAKTSVSNEGSLVASGIGLLGIPFGLMIPPFPGMKDNPATPTKNWLRFLPTIVFGGLALVFGGLAWVSAVPLARFLAIGAAALTATCLIPVNPFDGAHLKSRAVGLVSALALGALTVAFTVPII